MFQGVREHSQGQLKCAMDFFVSLLMSVLLLLLLLFLFGVMS